MSYRPAAAFARALRTTAARRALTFGTLGVAAYSVDKDQLATALSGLRADIVDRYTIKLDAAKVQPAGVAGTWGVNVDPATAVTHPLTLTPASGPELALLGVGVRTVSFISFKVYSAAFYANDYNLKRLASIPGWAGYEPAKLGEEQVQALLDVPTAVAVRIVPVRNTDFGHLRDGFTRTLLARAKDARKRGELSPEEDERITTAIQQLKAVFPAGSVPKNSVLTLVRTPAGLAVEYEGRVAGTVADSWVADNLIKAYFAEAPISPPLRDSAAQGFQKYFEGK